MKGFLHRLFEHPTTSSWGVVAAVLAVVAAVQHEWGYTVALFTLALQQFNSMDNSRVKELPPDKQPSEPPVSGGLPPIVLLVSGVLALHSCAAPRLSVASTLTVRDTVLVSAPARFDTLTRILKQVDTVRVDTGRVRVFIRRSVDTLRVAASCEPDTFRVPGAIRVERVYVPQPADCPPPTPWRERWALYALSFALGVVATGFALSYRR